MHHKERLLSYCLLRRGGLVEKMGRQIYLSDNAVLREMKPREAQTYTIPSDATVLSGLLRELGGGAMESSSIRGLPVRLSLLDRVLTEAEAAALFADERRMAESQPKDWKESWKHFCRFETGEKVPLAVLEPHVALLVKALSAAGCNTYSACEGHVGEYGLHVELHGPHNAAWADFLLQDARRAGVACPDLECRKQGAVLCGVDFKRRAPNPTGLHATRRQAIDLGCHLYLNRIRLRQERRDWIATRSCA